MSHQSIWQMPVLRKLSAMLYLSVLMLVNHNCAHGFGKRPSEPAITRGSYYGFPSVDPETGELIPGNCAEVLLSDGKTFLRLCGGDLANWIIIPPSDARIYDEWCHRRRE